MKEYDSEDRKWLSVATWLYLIALSVGLFLGLSIIKWIWPNSIPFEMLEFWKGNQVLAGIKTVWWIFLWGAGITFLYPILTRNRREENLKAENLFAFGALASICAGVLEEINFRWLIFFSGIIGVKITNFFFFGFLGFGIPKWFYLHITGPVVNFLTLDQLKEFLFHPAGWFVGAAILAANAKFRKGHKYLGIFGYFNSWFCGFVLFWLMFNYGLLAAVIVHFLYDFLIYGVRYLDRVFERKFLD